MCKVSLTCEHHFCYFWVGATYAGQVLFSEPVNHRLVTGYLSVPAEPRLDGALSPSRGVQDGGYKEVERQRLKEHASWNHVRSSEIR